MRLEWILWGVGGFCGAVFLLVMMRRRQNHLIELLLDYVKVEKVRSGRLERMHRLIDKSEKIRATTDKNEGT